MLAKFNGRCASCGESIRRGEEIGYSRDRGALHESCVQWEAEEAETFDDGAEDERTWPPSPSVLRSDRALGRRGLIVTRFSSGATMTRNARGRCEDAPCCGCCS